MPVQLGCCHEDIRCLLCPPVQPADAELVDALVHHYREERAPPGAQLEVRFFGGPAPADALLEAIGDLPFSARVRPDLLTRAEAARLSRRGIRAVELDVLTFDHGVLHQVGRHYRTRAVDQMTEGLKSMGIEVGGVLAPGLPGSSHATALRDAQRAADAWSFCRLHPVVVLARSRLRDLLERHRYTPLELGEAITVCREMMDVLEQRGVEVIRVGIQAGPDGLGRAIAGPRQGGLRELVEARRVLGRLREALQGCPPRCTVTVHCAPADETRTRGPFNLSSSRRPMN